MRLYVSRLLLVLVTALLIPISASAQTIHGCVKNKNGALRIVVDPSSCTPREMSISWNQQGPQGEPGIDGTDGVDGSDADVLRAFDANGISIGITSEIGGAGFIGPIFLQGPQITVIVNWADGSLQSPLHNLEFEEPGCQGIPFAGNDTTPARLFKNGPDPVRYFVANAEPYRIISKLSELDRNTGVCSPESGQVIEVLSVREILLSDLGVSFPLPAPLYVGLPVP